MNWKAEPTPKRHSEAWAGGHCQTKAVHSDELYISGKKSSPMTLDAKGISCLIGGTLTQSPPSVGHAACRALYRCQNDFLATSPWNLGSD